MRFLHSRVIWKSVAPKFIEFCTNDDNFGINAAIWAQHTKSSRTSTSKMTSTFYVITSTSSTLKRTSSFSELHRTTSSMSRSFGTSRSLLTTRSMSRSSDRQIVYVQIKTSTNSKSSRKRRIRSCLRSTSSLQSLASTSCVSQRQNVTGI